MENKSISYPVHTVQLPGCIEDTVRILEEGPNKNLEVRMVCIGILKVGGRFERTTDGLHRTDAFSSCTILKVLYDEVVCACFRKFLNVEN